jgi:hypothetical protein
LTKEDATSALTRFCLRGCTSLNPALQERSYPVDLSDLLVENLNPALRSKHAEVGNGRFRKHLQANGLALNFGCINTRLTNGHACLPLAEQFKQLTDLQRAFGRASAAVCTGARELSCS